MRGDEEVQSRPEHKQLQLALERQAEEHHRSKAEKKRESRKPVADAVAYAVGLAVAVAAAAAIAAATAVEVAVAVAVKVAVAILQLPLLQQKWYLPLLQFAMNRNPAQRTPRHEAPTLVGRRRGGSEEAARPH